MVGKVNLLLTLVLSMNTLYTSGSISMFRFRSSQSFLFRSWITDSTHTLKGSPTNV